MNCEQNGELTLTVSGNSAPPPRTPLDVEKQDSQEQKDELN